MLLHMKEPSPPAVPPDAHEECPSYRACPAHNLELLNQQGETQFDINLWCPGTALDAAHTIYPNREKADTWLVVDRATRRIVAICTPYQTQWSERYLDTTQKLGDRDESGFAGGLLSGDPRQPAAKGDHARAAEIRRQNARRVRERRKAREQGREPAPWAALLRAPNGQPGATLAEYKRESKRRADARQAALAAGQPLPEWAQRRIGA